MHASAQTAVHLCLPLQDNKIISRKHVPPKVTISRVIISRATISKVITSKDITSKDTISKDTISRAMAQHMDTADTDTNAATTKKWAFPTP